MFRLAAEEIVFVLICHKWLDISKREVYEYALEILLMNGSLLLVDFLLSLMFHQIGFFAAFLVFFVPLRVRLGGLHLDRAETCMAASVLYYMVLMFSYSYSYEKYANIEVIMMVLLGVACIVQNPLPEKIKGMKNHNKATANGIIVAELLVILLLWGFHVPAVSGMLVWELGALSLFLLGKLKWRFCE